MLESYTGIPDYSSPSPPRFGRYEERLEDTGIGQLGADRHDDGHLDGASVRDDDRRDDAGIGQLSVDAYDDGQLDGASV
jgi:hypothetical protein